MDPRHAFCSWCGLPLLAAAVPAAAADLRSSGERKQVTILFADIVASTALISGLDPEQSAAILDPMMRQMADIVADQDGFVARLTGDGIKAVFGIPATREDHAERACNAALAIRTVARDAGLRVRIGANSGEVVVRPLLNDHDAVGMAVHVAARVEQLARPGSIYLAAATARLIAGRFNLRSAGSRAAKGVRGPIELFELLDRSEQTRWAVRARQGLSTFVDRTDEMATILSALRAD